jgi:CS domain
MFLGPSLGLSSDGSGLLYVFPIKEEGISDAIGTFYLPRENEHRPFKLHYAYRESPTASVIVLSSKAQSNKLHGTGAKAKQAAVFDVWAARINLLSLRPGANPSPLDIVWHRHGEDIPVFGFFHPQFNSHLLLGDSLYHQAGAPIAPPYEPSPDEIAPIPRPNENLDRQNNEGEHPKPPPYSWTQTSDSVIVALPLPSATTKDRIRVSFSTKTLTVHVDYQASTPLAIPRYSGKELWDTINPSTSLWTWDRDGDHSYGLLTIHLDKKNEGTRWMHVFAAASGSGNNSSLPNSNNQDDNLDVPETLDPSELAQIRESLEKYTTSLRDGSDVSGLGLGTGVPSLAGGEMDDEVDLSVGRKVSLTWVAADGETPSWFNPIEQLPFHLLAIPMPGVAPAHAPFVIKHDLDGLVLNVKPSAAEEPLWNHESTFSAVAFVLASKRDTRFTYLVPSKGILCFEGGGRGRAGGNVYIYRPAATPKSNWAKQSILRVDGGAGEALLGVGGVTNGAGEFIVVCLLEASLVVIKQI